MLVAIGNTVANAQMYTNFIDDASIELTNAQGNTDDTLKLQIRDTRSTFPIAVEDEIHLIDETDANGWPSCNLLTNGSFEGTYSGGLAPNWSIGSNKNAGTITPALSTATHIFGASAQSVSISNIAFSGANTSANLQQTVTLLTDEQGNLIANQPYYLSCWYFVSAALVGCQLGIQINWYDKNNTFLANSYTFLGTLGVSSAWKRMSCNGTPPASAASATCFAILATSSTTNSGTVIFDGMQLEYATYGAYSSNTFAVGALNNATLTVSPGATISDGWGPTGPTTGVTYASGNVNGNTGQQVTCVSTPAAGTTVGITQVANFNPLQNYTASMTYQVTTALAANSYVTFGAQWQNAAGTTLGATLFSNGPSGEGVSSALETLSFPLGPNTVNRPPAGAVKLSLYFGIFNSTATHSDAAFFNSVAVAPWSNQQQPNYASVFASQAGIYPTPYIDESLAGDGMHMVWKDREITNLYYRAQRIFGGHIRHAKQNYTAGPERVWDIDAVDFGVILSEALLVLVVRGQNITYQPNAGQKDSLAIAAACQYAHNGGYVKGLDWTTHVANLTTIPAMSFNWVTLRDALAAIADVTIAAYWVDPYRYLWYQAALSVSSGFSVSSAPDFATSYPFEEWAIDYDSTQTRTTSVIQGSTQLSSPTTSQTMYSYTGTAQSALVNGTAYSTVAIAPNAMRISQVTGLLLSGTNGNTVSTAVDILPTPAAAPSLAAATGTSTFASGLVYVGYTYLYHDASGAGAYETALSPTASVSVTGTGQVVNVSAITPPSSGSTNGSGLYAINVYVSTGAGLTTLKLSSTQSATNNTVAAFSISGYGAGAAQPSTTAVTIPVQPFTASATTTVGDSAQAIRFTVNGGAPLYNVTQVLVNGTSQSVGMATATQTGFACYADPQPAQITFDPSAYPATGATVVVTFTFENPVLVRVTAPGGSTSSTNGRLIAFYQNVTNIQSIADAIDQANAQLAQYGKAQPLGHLRLHWPPCPAGANPHQGQYITVYHPPSLGAQPIKFQIQRVTTKVYGNNILVRDFELGFYRPDFATQMSQVTQDASHLASDLNASSVLNDVISASDKWAMTDSITAAVSNTAVWASNNWNDGTAFA